MVQLSPDNGLPGWDRISGYFYPDSTIAGFSHTHLSGTGAGDLYDISFMPVTLPYKEAEEPLGIHSRFSHADEAASAGYYRVLLKDYGINVELTATERCGIQRYTFPEADAAVILNLRKAMNWDFTEDSYIEKVDSVTIQGYRFSDGWARGQRIFFRTRFSRPFETMQLDSAAVLKDGKRIGTSVMARFDFKTAKGEQLLVSTAISGVSMEGAARNLAAEVPDDDFDKYLAAARKNWNGHLSRIEIECDNHDEKVKFYTALYHSMLAPTIYADVDGSYYGPDKQIHKADGWTNYSTFSLWDTYRASHPLYTYIEPARVNDMVKSFLAFYEQNGRLPVWNFYGSETDMMIGYHSVPVIVDACLKGIGDFDAKNQVKTRDRVTIPLSEETKKWMPKREEGIDNIFHNLTITSTTVEVVLKEWMEAAGITKHITYHCSRHTAATMLLTLGASIYVVSKILGHKSIKMTEIYAKIVDKKKLETVNLVNGMFDQIPVIQ